VRFSFTYLGSIGVKMTEIEKQIKKDEDKLYRKMIKPILKSIAQFVLFVIFLNYHSNDEFQKMVFVGFLILFSLLM